MLDHSAGGIRELQLLPEHEGVAILDNFLYVLRNPISGATNLRTRNLYPEFSQSETFDSAFPDLNSLKLHRGMDMDEIRPIPTFVRHCKELRLIHVEYCRLRVRPEKSEFCPHLSLLPTTSSTRSLYTDFNI